MTRREKILLQILVAVGLVGMSIIYLLMPAIKDKKAWQKELDTLQLQELQMEAVLLTPNVEESLQQQKELAAKNYEYFYSQLNSYTVDDILNHLVAESGLEMLGMSIGDYSPVRVDTLYRSQKTDENAEADEEERSYAEILKTVEGTQSDTKTSTADAGEQEDFLLGCTVTLNVKGSYRQVLNLVDIFERESTCIEVTKLNLSQNQRIVDVEEPIEATLSLLIYGIRETVKEDA